MSDTPDRLRESVKATIYAIDQIEGLLDLQKKDADQIKKLEKIMAENSQWASELDLSRCKRRIQELVDRIEEMKAKADQQEHYYQMNVARIDELETALREIAELHRDPAGKGAEIARRALSETFVEETQVEGKP